ncbi:MAG: RNA polymerase sigma factor (sigma-70 family) [Marinoscillum sp.]
MKRWAKKVHQQIYWMTRDHESANDLSQDCWIVVSKTLHNLSDPNKFGSWILRIAHNKTVDYLRKNQRNLEVLSQISASTEAPPFASEGEQESTYKDLIVGLAELDKLHKTVIRMYYLNDMSVTLISEVLKIPSGTVKSRLFKAREKFNKIIQQNGVNHEK